MTEIVVDKNCFRVWGSEPYSEIPELVGFDVIRHNDHFELDKKDLLAVLNKMKAPYIYTDKTGEQLVGYGLKTV